MYKLYPHQIEFSKEVFKVLSKFNICYLAGEVRSQKTGTVLEVCRLFGVNNVLIITKLKAMPSIKKDYDNFGFTYNLELINYESLHKIDPKGYDLIIYDEAHSLGAYPKPSNRTKLAKKLFYNIPCILMSGTPFAESQSQLYHQFYVSAFSPFKKYTNFYKWANDFVDKKEMRLPTHTVTDYSGAKVKEINAVIKPYFVKMTQSDANFSVKINEYDLEIEIPNKIKLLAKRLLKDKAIEGKSGYILGDSPAKLQSKVHQIYNGSCIIETPIGENKTIIFSNYKAKFILEHFKDKKIAIMYYYQAELDILKQTFGNKITTDLEAFNNENINFAIQCNTTEGLNLSKADCLVYYNLGYSGKNFIQSRDRLTVRERKSNDVYFVCEKEGITKNILNAVRQKKDYNSRTFKKDFVN